MRKLRLKEEPSNTGSKSKLSTTSWHLRFFFSLKVWHNPWEPFTHINLIPPVGPAFYSQTILSCPLPAATTAAVGPGPQSIPSQGHLLLSIPVLCVTPTHTRPTLICRLALPFQIFELVKNLPFNLDRRLSKDTFSQMSSGLLSPNLKYQGLGVVVVDITWDFWL